MQEPSIFSIYIIEQTDGSVNIVSSCQGDGARPLEIGLEIMANLKAAECEHPDMLSVSPFICSEYRQ